MTKIVNLNRARKQKARADKRSAGAENAARHGTAQVVLDLNRARAEKMARELDGHKREDPTDE